MVPSNADFMGTAHTSGASRVEMMTMKKKKIDAREQSDRTYVLVEARGILQFCKDRIRLDGKPCECPFLNDLATLDEDDFCLLHCPYYWDMETIERRAKGLDDE